MTYRLDGPIKDYTDLELALLVMQGQFGNGQERRDALGIYYPAVQAIVEDLAVGVVPAVHYEYGKMTDDEIKKALEKIRPTNADFDEMVNDFIKALK